MTSEITSTSTLTDVLNALEAQGIVNIAQPAFFDEDNAANHKLAASIVTKSMFQPVNPQGYIFITAAGMAEWEDTRYLRIHVGAVTTEELPWYAQETAHYRINQEVRKLVEVAGFSITQDYPLTIHVPKSRF